MSAADNCRAKAAKLFAKAETESNQTVRAEFENLAEAFLRVAEQAERDAAFAAETELPSPKIPGHRPPLSFKTGGSSKCGDSAIGGKADMRRTDQSII
jgi:hypothetical protein